MKIENILALIVVVLAPCLATVAQTTPTAPPAAVVPSTPAPAPAPNTPAAGQGDVLPKGAEASVVAHGTATDQPPQNVLSLTNESPNDEVREVVLFNDIPLTDAVKTLALEANLNIIFDPRLLNTTGPDGRTIPATPPNIDIKWKNLTAKQALLA